MKLNIIAIVKCHDNNEYVISERTKENYFIGLGINGNRCNQRLFKPDGQYAGSDKAKNVARIL